MTRKSRLKNSKAMAEIVRNRTIRPSTRLVTSKRYKINTEWASKGDVLVVNIDHESKPFQKTYKFNGMDIADKKNIHFIVSETGTSIEIAWSGVDPKI